MYDKNTLIDALFQTLYDTWEETRTYATGEEAKDIESLLAAIKNGSGDIEGEISLFACSTERRAAKRAFTAGFKAARELLTGIPCGEAFV